MNVNVSNVLTLTDYPPNAIKWCEKELTLPNPEYSKKLRMHLWLGNTPKYLSLYEKRGDSLVLPFGTLRRVAEFAPRDTEYSSGFAEVSLVDYQGCEVPLYPYQRDAVAGVYQGKYGILRSPAGSGKTQMGIALVKRFGRRALWLTHTLDLLNQSKQRAEEYIDPSLIGTVTEGKVNIGSGITFATIQTMCKLDLAQYQNYWDVIIVDECHRCAGTPTAMTQFFRVLNALSARHKIGLSATVHRSDGMIAATYALLGEILYTVPEEAVGDKIMKVGIQPVSTGIGLSHKCLNTDGTLNYARLVTYLTDNPYREAIIINALKQNAERSCLVLSDRLNHLEHLMSWLPADMQAYAVMVNGNMTSKRGKAEREKAIEDMRAGRKKYLFATYSLAKEGLDIPRLERLFLTTPQKDYAVITQSVGRIARAFNGKDAPICYDFVDDAGYLVKAFKKRCATYRKNNCYFVKEVQNADSR